MGGNTLVGATGQEQIAGEFQRRLWTSSYGWRTLADIKPCKDAIRWCFRKITPVVVRRMSLSGNRSQGDQEKGTVQPERRYCYISLLIDRKCGLIDRKCGSTDTKKAS